MTPERMTGSAVSIVVKTYWGLLDMFPELIKMLTEYRTSSYYQEYLLKNISSTGNAVVISSEDIAIRPMEIKLQEKGIPFQMVPAQDFSEYIKSNGRYLFLLRENDLERAMEAAEEVKKEFSKDRVPIGEDEPKVEEAEEYEHVKEENVQSEDTIPEDSLSAEEVNVFETVEEEPVEEGSSGKASGKKEKKNKVNDVRSSRPPDSNPYFGESSSYDQTEGRSQKPLRQDHTENLSTEYHHTAERKESAQASLNKSVDFHSKKVETAPGEEHQGRILQNTERRVPNINTPDSAASPQSFHEKPEIQRHADGKLSRGDNPIGIRVIGNGYDIRNTDRMTALYEHNTNLSRGGAVSGDRQISNSAAQLHKSAVSTTGQSYGSPTKSEPNSAKKHDQLTPKPILPRYIGADKSALNRPEEQDIRIIEVIKGPELDHNMFQMAEIQNGKVRAPLNMTHEILRERRVHSIRDVLASRHFSGAIFVARHTVTQSILDHDTEAGRVVNNVDDFVSPIGRYAKSKFLAHGAMALNKDIFCNDQIFCAAYAAKYGCDINTAHKILVESNSLDELIQHVNGKSMNLQDVEDLRNAIGQEGFISILNGLTDQGFANFLKYADISDELKRTLLGYSRKALNDPNQIVQLMKKFSGRSDQECLRMIYGSIISGRFRHGMSISALFQGNLVQILKRMSRDSEAGRAGTSIYYSGKTIYSTYRAGIKLTMTVLRKFNIVDPSMDTRLALEHPARAIRKHSFKVAKKAVKKAAATHFGHSVGVIARGFTRSVRGIRVVNHTINSLKTISLMKQGITAAIMNTKIMVQLSQFGKAAAQWAAKAGAALGWIAAVAIIIIILLEIGQGLVNTKEEDSGVTNHIYAQETELLQEIIDELSAKNEAFIVDINNAANHRGSYSVNSGFTADENVSFYESGAYHIIFRDFYGNKLEPTHVDFNNTKAIISMATKFMPYPFAPLSGQASEEEKKAYEEIKQHFKDYCNYLWVSTHQISIEEYHPGDNNYSDIDSSALVTELSTGKCDKDGSLLWLPDDFLPNIISSCACEDCQQAETTGLGLYNDDLCSHGKEKNPHGGWRMTGRTVQHINCPYGHEHHDDDDDWTEYCEFNDIQNNSHIHTCYEWVYECGGHMGSVVYVTIGDLSRIPSFGVAGDVDYEAVGIYNAGDSVNGTDIPESSESNPDEKPE